MFDIGKDQSFASRGIPLGILEVKYPVEGCGRAALHALVERELAALRERYADYDRKAVFGENPYFRFLLKREVFPVILPENPSGIPTIRLADTYVKYYNIIIYIMKIL